MTKQIRNLGIFLVVIYAALFLVVALHHHFDEDRVGQAERRLVRHGGIALDDARLLQPLHAGPAGRGGKADLLGQFGVGQPPLAGECP